MLAYAFAEASPAPHHYLSRADENKQLHGIQTELAAEVVQLTQELDDLYRQQDESITARNRTAIEDILEHWQDDSADIEELLTQIDSLTQQLRQITRENERLKKDLARKVHRHETELADRADKISELESLLALATEGTLYILSLSLSLSLSSLSLSLSLSVSLCARTRARVSVCVTDLYDAEVSKLSRIYEVSANTRSRTQGARPRAATSNYLDGQLNSQFPSECPDLESGSDGTISVRHLQFMISTPRCPLTGVNLHGTGNFFRV